MDWMRGGAKFIRTPDDRFYISKGTSRGEVVYTLADGDTLVCSERGDGALQLCKDKAAQLAATNQPRRASRFAKAA
ncbi:hypothetical protein NG831_06435 [Xanthomonas sacchari]|uniref:hypothetical protein n=1 Tax=Xanthomonas sacchari TaxID=56458 RepID=UPI00224F99B1|nr:hypothetical protein [Xanthomonas sacchari]MCW0413500.1 hypothetical protein [Xanthomonas sacchari]UYK67797.1 hypothetical protein NG831_06435 [Xanthomonas sacchari]